MYLTSIYSCIFVLTWRQSLISGYSAIKIVQCDTARYSDAAIQCDTAIHMYHHPSALRRLPFARDSGFLCVVWGVSGVESVYGTYNLKVICLFRRCTPVTTLDDRKPRPSPVYNRHSSLNGWASLIGLIDSGNDSMRQ